MLAIAKYVSSAIFDTGFGNADLKTIVRPRGSRRAEYIQSIRQRRINNQLSIKGGSRAKISALIVDA